MAFDPLAKFRPAAAPEVGGGSAPAAAPAPSAEEAKEEAALRVSLLPGMAGEVYEAFKPVSRVQRRLRIVPAKGETETPANVYLERVSSDGMHGRNMILTYPFGKVLVSGRNLLVVIGAVEKEQCLFIQAYDPERWPEPSDPKAPFIAEIEIHLTPTEEGGPKQPLTPEEKKSKDEKEVMRLAAKLLSEKLFNQMQGPKESS